MSSAGIPYLMVEGTKLTDNTGGYIQLKGASAHDQERFPVTQAMVKYLRRSGANVMRVPLMVNEGPLANYAQALGGVKAAANLAIESNMYVIFDFHARGSPANKNLKGQALRFFRDIVTTYGAGGRAIYEVFNEPTNATWVEIKAYAEDVIKLIRLQEKKLAISVPSLILVGTPNLSTDVRSAANDPIQEDNVAYTFHFYAKSQPFDPDLMDVAEMIPIFVTQWSPFAVNDGSTYESIEKETLLQYINWFRQREISWLSWSYSDELLAHRWFKPGSLAKGEGPSPDMLEPWGLYARSLLR